MEDFIASWLKILWRILLVNPLVSIRNIQRKDYSRLFEIWQAVGLTLGASDTEPEVWRLVERNPGTCLVLEEGGQIVGCVMGGFDGRRGLVHHLAVDPQVQGKGYGRMLMAELDGLFRKMGVVKYSFWIEADNPLAIDFYKHIGYDLRDLITMSKTLIDG